MYDDDFVLMTTQNGRPLNEHTTFCQERYNNWCVEIECKEEHEYDSLNVDDIVPPEWLKQSKKCTKWKSLGFTQGMFVVYCPSSCTCTTVFLLVDLTECRVLCRPEELLFNIYCATFCFDSIVQCEELRTHIQQHELLCRIIHNKLQCENQCHQWNKKLDKLKPTPTNHLSKAIANLQHDHEDTSAKLTAQAVVSELHQTKIDTIQTVLHTIQDSQRNVQHTLCADLESRGDWTTCVMTKIEHLEQRYTEWDTLSHRLHSLQHTCTQLQHQMSQYEQTLTYHRWVGSIVFGVWLCLWLFLDTLF